MDFLIWVGGLLVWLAIFHVMRAMDVINNCLERYCGKNMDVTLAKMNNEIVPVTTKSFYAYLTTKHEHNKFTNKRPLLRIDENTLIIFDGPDNYNGDLVVIHGDRPGDILFSRLDEHDVREIQAATYPALMAYTIGVLNNSLENTNAELRGIGVLE